MGADQHHDWRAAAASALEWWRDAGVDTLVDDAPRDWLARAPAPQAAAPVVEAEASALPATLAEFAAWRVGGDVPEANWGRPMVAAEGDPAAEIMVVVDVPTGDALIDGAAGRLFDRMVAAVGLDRGSIYLASLAVACPLGNRIPPESEARLATLLAHHVTLTAPKRLLLLGRAPSRALIGTDDATASRNLHVVNLNGVTVEAVASLHPRLLLERPAMKAEAWKDLQLLMGGLR